MTITSSTPTVTFTVPVTIDANSTVVASPTSVPADGASSSTITVTLKDADSVGVSGKTVSLAQGAGNSTISAASGPSDSSGVVTFTVTNTLIETVTYQATDTTDSVLITETAGVTFTTAPILQQLHYRWRNDDAGESGGMDTGTGADGALAPAGTFNLNTDTSGGRSYADGIAYQVNAPADAASSVTRFNGADLLSNGIVNGDEVLLINMQGASGDHADKGNYEILKVQSVTVSTITFTASISKSYDGTTAANQKVVVQRVPNYTSVTLDSTDSLTASAWDGLAAPTPPAGYSTGIVVLRATGTVSVVATASITVAGLGYRGGAGIASDGGNNGESYDGQNGKGGGNDAQGTLGGGAGENKTSGNTTGTRGGGGGGGETTDGGGGGVGYGGGGGAGGGYAGGGGGGGGGSDSVVYDSGPGGAGGTTGDSAGGGGTGVDSGASGAGGAAGNPPQAGGGSGGGAVGSGTTTGTGWRSAARPPGLWPPAGNALARRVGLPKRGALSRAGPDRPTRSRPRPPRARWPAKT